MRLTHFTRSIDSVLSILKDGFVFVATRRKLIKHFVPEGGFDTTEPNQFGTVSFTELEPPLPPRDMERFGRFGIAVSAEWAMRRRAARVIYVDEDGPVFDALKVIYRIGLQDVEAKIRYPEDGLWRGAKTVPSMAAWVGSPLWSNLTILHSYMEHGRYSYQREWRVIQDKPMGGVGRTAKQAIAKVIPALGWHTVDGVAALHVRPGDVDYFRSPASEVAALHAALPPAFKSVEILPY
jgi:hypothetical protein